MKKRVRGGLERSSKRSSETSLGWVIEDESMRQDR